jgi:hypothetical protein
MSLVLDIAQKVLKPYTTNKNTGNVYEIYTILSILRKMGLTNENIDILKPLLESIEALGKGNCKTITLIPIIKEILIQKEFWFDGNHIIDIKNVTQDDNDGGTGDIILISNNKKELSISIREGSMPRSNILNKVVNPSCSKYGCSKDDEQSIKDIEKESLKEYIEKYGSDKDKWPKRGKTTIAVDACKKVVDIYEKRFDTYKEEEKRKLMNSIHHINEKPADYLCLVNKKFRSSTYLHIGDCKINKDTWIPFIKKNSVFISVFDKDILVSRTQVKFNNGIGTSMRKWNVNLVLSNLYEITKLNKESFNKVL